MEDLMGNSMVNTVEDLMAHSIGGPVEQAMVDSRKESKAPAILAVALIGAVAVTAIVAFPILARIVVDLASKIPLISRGVTVVIQAAAKLF